MNVDRIVIGCRNETCTFIDTQVCARTGGPDPCEYAIWPEAATSEPELVETDLAPRSDVVSAPLPAEDLGLHVGQELGIEDLAALMNGTHYARFITVLGDAKAGKTSLLITFYLLLASGELEERGISFAGSLTLPGFETRSRHTRVWNVGQAPAAMTARTLIGAGRGPGFLHLDLAHGELLSRSRLLISDLPGEWTKDLILNSRHAERLRFARRSDAIIIVVDGEQLVGPGRWAVFDDQSVLIDRLVDMLGTSRPSLALIATRADIIGGTANPPELERLAAHAQSAGFAVTAFTICTFAADANTPSAAGVPEVLDWCLGTPRALARGADVYWIPDRVFGWHPAMQNGAIP